MRKFSSYGPIDKDLHYHVPRKELIESAYRRLIGEDPEKGGHYITVWAPRQTGKTWVMFQVEQKLWEQGDFDVAIVSMQSAKSVTTDEGVLEVLVEKLGYWFDRELPKIDSWKNLAKLFTKEWFEKPLILILDEFDALRKDFINKFANEFRDIHIWRQSEARKPSNEKRCLLHGLALIGVRSVLGIEDDRGSPFNVQQSVRIPNLTHVETTSMFEWYRKESGQEIESAVVDKTFNETNGQPGLVSWFGELLTVKYNPGRERKIDMDAWKTVWLEARTGEPNNNLFNLIAKARKPEYQGFLTELFSAVDEPFLFYDSTHSYLLMHGVIDSERIVEPDSAVKKVCRFASPFIQRCLFDALGRDLIGVGTPILALDPLDDLEEVFEGPDLDLPGLLKRYMDYLARLKSSGIDPWKDRPRRSDMRNIRITEAVGHFHLYAWLQEAVDGVCVVSPEFPTGNGKVDLHLKCGNMQGVIEVKSFRNQSKAKEARGQAARYAKSLALAGVTLAIFTPSYDKSVLEKLSVKETIDGVTVTVVAIGWP
ncbi:MAG: hypothetical protein GY850_41705 [bacterium]|nr:hypothetical protein [bacterium]